MNGDDLSTVHRFVGPARRLGLPGDHRPGRLRRPSADRRDVHRRPLVGAAAPRATRTTSSRRPTSASRRPSSARRRHRRRARPRPTASPSRKPRRAPRRPKRSAPWCPPATAPGGCRPFADDAPGAASRAATRARGGPGTMRCRLTPAVPLRIVGVTAPSLGAPWQPERAEGRTGREQTGRVAGGLLRGRRGVVPARSRRDRARRRRRGAGPFGRRRSSSTSRPRSSATPPTGTGSRPRSRPSPRGSTRPRPTSSPATRPSR